MPRRAETAETKTKRISRTPGRCASPGNHLFIHHLMAHHLGVSVPMGGVVPTTSGSAVWSSLAAERAADLLARACYHLACSMAAQSLVGLLSFLPRSFFA